MSSDSSSLPVGTILAIYKQNPKEPPVGWLLCDGSKVDADTYPELSAQIGDTLPDLTGRAIVGADLSATTTPGLEGSVFGAASMQLSMSQMPSHQHYGWGENPDATNNGQTGIGFGTSTKTGYWGNNHLDNDNAIFGTTYAGGSNSDNGDIKVENTNGGPSTTSSKHSSNESFDLYQPSLAIFYYIYAGSVTIAPAS